MNCKGIFGRMFGHNYQPVFELVAPERIDVGTGRVETIVRIVKEMTDTKYVHTCCTRCGDVIEARMP